MPAISPRDLEAHYQQSDTAPFAYGAATRAIFQGDADAAAQAITAWRINCPDIRRAVKTILPPVQFAPGIHRLLGVAIDMAAEPHTEAFHNNRHFLEVFLLTAMLGYRAWRRHDIDDYTLGYLLVAALLHDYKRGPDSNGAVQYKLERKSFENAKAGFLAAGALPQELEIFQAFIFATDVSKDFSNPKALSPADSLKTGNTADIFPELQVLERRGLIDAALMLHDADVATGVLTPEICHQAGEYYANELGKPYDPKNQMFFLDKICHRRMFSRAGIEIIQPAMNNTIKTFEALVTTKKPAPKF